MTIPATQGESVNVPGTDAIASDSLNPESSPKSETTEVKKDDFTDKFARLAQLDKAQRTRDAEIKARQKELADRESKIKEDLELARLFRENPLEAVKKSGLNLNELYSKSLDEIDTESDPVLKKLTELEKWKEAQEKSKTEEKTHAEIQAQERMEKAEKDYLEKLSGFVKSNEEKFPLLALYDDANDQVYQLIRATYEASGDEKKILSEEEACAELQKHLVETYEKAFNNERVLKLFKLKKDNSDTNFESFLRPESGTTLDQTFTSPVSNTNVDLSDEAARIRAATKLADQLFKQQRGE